MKAIDQYFPVVLFIILYKVVLTFESVDKFLCIQNKKAIAIMNFDVPVFPNLEYRSIYSLHLL